MDYVDILVPVFVSLLIAAGSVLQQNKKRGQAYVLEQAEMKQITERNTRNEKELADLRVIVEDQRKQVQALSAFRQLFESLTEAHNLLKSDYDSLKIKVDQQGVRITELSTALDQAKVNETNLKKEVEHLRIENATLQTSVSVYQDALSRVHESLSKTKGIEPAEAAPERAEAAGVMQEAE